MVLLAFLAFAVSDCGGEIAGSVKVDEATLALIGFGVAQIVEIRDGNLRQLPVFNLIELITGTLTELLEHWPTGLVMAAANKRISLAE